MWSTNRLSYTYNKILTASVGAAPRQVAYRDTVNYSAIMARLRAYIPSI